MIKIKVPATSANIGPGFDSIGLALSLYNTFTFEEIPKGLEIMGCDDRFKGEDNLVYTSMKRTLAEIGHEIGGIRITMETNIPVSRGLGSSAACIVAGILGANELAGSPLSKDGLLKIATEIEGHPDNVAPALLGGLVTSIAEGDEVFHNNINVAKGIKFIALIPDFSLSTKEAREVLPKEISFKDGVFNVSRVSLLLSAFSNGKFELLKYGVEDKLHQNYRSKLIPDFDKIKDICNKYNSFGTFISGAGPTIITIIDEKNKDFIHELKNQLNSLKNNWLLKELDIDLEGAAVYKEG